MNTGKYSFIELLEFKNLDQFIIPEIQRDYVWQISDVSDFLDYISDGFSKAEKDIPYLGFIYAYNDRDYVHKYFLVDGQQRMTTIYLLLLACYRKLSKKLPDYMTFARNPKIDYKVRQATHDFLTDFISHDILASGQGRTIEDQAWYHAEYANDPTIKNMIFNYEFMVEWLDQFSSEELSKFTKFVEDTVDISYFDIDDGRQGEDLYIYMNSRGRQLEANETLKANFLSRLGTDADKLRWGKVWEEWQDFFWKQRNKKKHPDADVGFNEFLKMVQIINMCNLNITVGEIIKFASDKGTKGLNVQRIAANLEDLQSYFETYRWLLESELISAFFQQYEGTEVYLSSGKDWKLIDYLRVLPIVNLVAKTGNKDVEAVIRFVRFFYNISRKRDIGKDIASQLPIAIRLTSEYSSIPKGSIDVCELVNYQKGRTTLIDREETMKLNLFADYDKVGRRREIEHLIWAAEDHFIFNGGIYPLLQRHLSSEGIFSEEQFKNSLDSMKLLFIKDQALNAQICRALLYYGNTWIQDSPYYYTNYDCQDWATIVTGSSGKFLFNLIEDMHGKQINYLDHIIRHKIYEYFANNDITTIEAIKSREGLIEQVRVLVAIDYYTNKIIWGFGAYIAQDERYNWPGYPVFFNSDRTDKIIYNVSRYVKDGSQGRLLKEMTTVLQDYVLLNNILEKILSKRGEDSES